jgi:hypothetical protein
MKVFLRSSLAVSLLVGISCAQNQVKEVFSPPPGQPRFPDPSAIVAVKLQNIRPALVQAFPKYPRALEPDMVSGALLDAFVIDTTGRVELSTASFLQAGTPAFERAVCEALPKLRYAPLVVGGVKRRALVAQVNMFVGGGGLDPAVASAASALHSRIEDEFASTPIVSTVTKLEPLPHCDTIKL